MFPRVLSVLVAVLLAATHASAQTLTTDASSAPYHSVVHLIASAPAGASVTFRNGSAPLATIPSGPNGLAVLGIASLTPGTHTLTAGASAPVTVTVTPLPAPFAFSVDQSITFQHTQLAFALAGVNPKASGTLTYTDNGTPIGTDNLVPQRSVPTYRAFGDSITYGYSLANQGLRYADLFANANGFSSYLNNADNGALTCDLLTRYMLPIQTGSTQDASPLYTVMTGSSDAIAQGAPNGEPNFTACHLATLAWLGIPREYKILPGDPALTTLSGTWSLPPAVPAAPYDSTDATLYNSSGSGAAQFSITSNGGPLYLWYLISDHISGSFTVSIDAVPTGNTYSSSPPTPISSLDNRPYSDGFALLRLPVAPGPHTLRVDIVSGTVGLLAAATPPSAGPASVHPVVFSTDIPYQNSVLGSVTPAVIDRYSADALADVNLLVADGLDIRTVPTHTYLTGDPTQYTDFAHPNPLGHQLLAAALESAFANTGTAPFLTNGPAIPRHYTNAGDPGPHVYTVTYSGDQNYQPYTASVTVTVVASGHSSTTLSTPATTLYAAQTFAATASIFPPTPAATVALVESGQIIAAIPTGANSVANFSLPLSVGLHTLSAAYGGDATYAASASPPLTVQVLKNLTTLTLSGVPNQLPAWTPYPLTINAQPATATGKLTFTDTFTPSGAGAIPTIQSIGEATLTNGSATFTTPALRPGTHAITASYVGDPSNNPATSTPAVTVVALIPTLTGISATPAPRGQPSTFTATVLPADSPGTLTFTDQTTGTTYTQPVVDGTASWTTSTFTTGPHTLTANYSGDPTHGTSASTQIVAVIPRTTSAVTLSSSATSLYTGLPITFTAAVTPSSATGTITFSDPVVGTLGLVPAASGSLTIPSLPAGTYAITATYSGDPDTSPSTSSPVSVQVLSHDTVTTLTAPATASFATNVTLSATVATAPTSGLIRFFDNGTLLGTSALQNGTATLTTAALTPGVHALSATFPGNATQNPSTGNATVTITPAASITSLTLAQSTVLAGSNVNVNLRITTTATTPTGTLTLRSGSATLASGPATNAVPGAAYATFTFPTTAAGTYPLTAAYSGDTGTAASDTASSYTVTPRIATGTLTLSATQIPPQVPVTLTAAFTSPGTSGPALVPSGSVTFSTGTTTLATVPLDATGQATYTLPAQAIGTYSLTAVYQPTGVFTASAVSAQVLTVTAPLAIAFPTPTITMAPATTMDTSATLTPLSGFQGTIATKCTTDAAYLTCTIDAPTTLTTATTAHVHLAVAKTIATSEVPNHPVILAALLLPLLLLRRRRHLAALLLALISASLILTTGCAPGGTFANVPTGTHQVYLTTTAANTPTTATLTINIQ